MKKTFILALAMVFAGLALNWAKLSAQEVRRVREPVVVRSTGERFERGDYLLGQDIKSSRLSLSKHFEGESVSKTGTFNVEEGIRMLEISIKGSAQEGSISVSISKPGKNLFKEQVIDASADIEWTQMFTIKEDSKEYTGEWTYKIQADKAKGFYSLSITAH
jgi:hypothetical protein